MPLARTLSLALWIVAGSVPALAELARTLSVDGPDPAPAPCIQREKSGFQEPASLQSLLDCQFRLRIDWMRRYNEKRRRPPSNASLDELDDFQRAEVREYLSRHPDRAHTDYVPGYEQSESQERVRSSKTANRGPASAERCRPPRLAAARAPSDPGGAFARQRERTADAMDENVKGRDADLKQDIKALDESLAARSDEGRSGITQEGAIDIVEFLECEQGGVSDDMRDLLNRVVRDGGKLQHDTMLRLKQAARSA